MVTKTFMAGDTFAFPHEGIMRVVVKGNLYEFDPKTIPDANRLMFKETEPAVPSVKKPGRPKKTVEAVEKETVEAIEDE